MYRKTAVRVEPQLRALVALTEFTNDGYVRHASFISLIDTPCGAEVQTAETDKHSGAQSGRNRQSTLRGAVGHGRSSCVGVR